MNYIKKVYKKQFMRQVKMWKRI